MTRPHAGGRITLELVRAAGDVEYRAELATPEATHVGVARVRADGGVELGGWDREPPAWLATFASAFLRSEWRARQKEPAPWPRRLRRWREAPGRAG